MDEYTFRWSLSVNLNDHLLFDETHELHEADTLYSILSQYDR